MGTWRGDAGEVMLAPCLALEQCVGGAMLCCCSLAAKESITAVI